VTEQERESKRVYERMYYAKHKAQFSEKNHSSYMRNRRKRISYAAKRYAERSVEINERRRALYKSNATLFGYLERRRIRCKMWKAKNSWSLRSSQKRYDEERKVRENLLKAKDPTYYAFMRALNRIYLQGYRRKQKPDTSPYVPRMSQRIPDWCPFSVSCIDFRSRFLSENIGTSEKAFARETRSLG